MTLKILLKTILTFQILMIKRISIDFSLDIVTGHSSDPPQKTPLKLELFANSILSPLLKLAIEQSN